MSQLIEHSGVVVRSEQGVVDVKITAQSACGGCHAREICGMGETDQKIIEVPMTDAQTYIIGEQVMVGVHRRAGGMAVILAYVGALVVLVTVLVVAIMALGISEGYAALVSLLSVGAYYGILWLCRHKIENRIHFTISKQ